MAALKPTTVVVAAHSALGGDAVCRFLETCDGVQVLAEVRSGQELQSTVSRHRPDVVVLSQRLPHMGDMLEAVRSSPIPPGRFVCMTSTDLRGRSVGVGLHQLGVHCVLTGAFGPGPLLRAISLARPRPSVLCIRGLTSAAGQTTVAFGVLLGFWRLGYRAQIVDRGARCDLTALLESSPWLQTKVMERSSDSPEASLTIVDGCLNEEANREIVVIPRTFGATRILNGQAQTGALLVDNEGVGSGKAPPNSFIRLIRIRPSLLEDPPRAMNDRRLAALATMTRRLVTEGFDPGERSRVSRLFHGVQP